MVSSGHHIRSAGGDKQVESAYCTGTYGRNSLSARETTYPAKSINSHGRRRRPMTARSEIGGDDDGTPRASVEYGHVQFRGPTIRNDGEHLRLDKSRAPRRTGSLLPWLRGENIQLVSGLLKQVTTCFVDLLPKPGPVHADHFSARFADHAADDHRVDVLDIGGRNHRADGVVVDRV